MGLRSIRVIGRPRPDAGVRDGRAREAPTLQLDAPLTSFESLAAGLGEPASWQHRPVTWIEDVAILLGVGGLAVLGTGVAVRRRPPGVP